MTHNVSFPFILVQINVKIKSSLDPVYNAGGGEGVNYSESLCETTVVQNNELWVALKTGGQITR